ncbi:hypothetical protein [Actinoplanes sp. NPDC051859]|uniref:hypothetical protein n=1 Tax=Actinoplanes sp. NPDC051859 TaxID=3363909 RepID=UPI0037A0E669
MRATKLALPAVAFAALVGLFAPTAATAADTTAAPRSKTFSYNFAQGQQGWVADYADYSAEYSDAKFHEFFETDHGIRRMPAGTATGTGYYIQGNNHSDDLFMYLRKKLTKADGIIPGKTYTVKSSVTFWSQEHAGQFGVGGSPGASVYVKAGASPQEPAVYVDASDNHKRVQLEKGNQNNDGPQSVVLGNIENGLPSDSPKKWAKVKRTSTATNTITVTAAADGTLWLHAGTDSGFESLTQLYYTNITTTLTPR